MRTKRSRDGAKKKKRKKKKRKIADGRKRHFRRRKKEKGRSREKATRAGIGHQIERDERMRGRGEQRSSAAERVFIIRKERTKEPAERRREKPKPASDDVVLTTPSFARTYSPLRAIRSTLAYRTCMYIEDSRPSLFARRTTAPIRTGRKSARSLNGQLSPTPFSCLAFRALVSLAALLSY